jgi:hypothetical protein
MTENVSKKNLLRSEIALISFHTFNAISLGFAFGRWSSFPKMDVRPLLVFCPILVMLGVAWMSYLAWKQYVEPTTGSHR